MPNSTEPTIQSIAEGLTVMANSLRGQAPDTVTGAMANVWLSAMLRNGVSAREFADRCLHLADTSQFFPSIGEFLKPIRDAKPSFAVIEDPVLTGENEIGSRRLAESKGLPYLELGSAETLPSPHNSPSPLPPVKTMPQLPSPKDIEAKRELMRRQAGKC